MILELRRNGLARPSVQARGLPLIDGVGMRIGAMTAMMLRLPLTSVLLATLLPGTDSTAPATKGPQPLHQSARHTTQMTVPRTSERRCGSAMAALAVLAGAAS
jgi:hypothetical protein